MSQWAERVRTHAVWTQMQTLGPALDNARRREGIDTATVDSVERIRTALALIGTRLASVDPFIVNPSLLDSLNGYLTNATNEIQSFVSNGTSGHLTNANAQIDASLNVVAQIPIPISASEFHTLNQAATEYRSSLYEKVRQAESNFESVAQQYEETKRKLETLQSELTVEKARLTTLATDYQAQFSTAQESRNKEHAEAQATRQESFSSSNADFVKQFNEQYAEFVRKNAEHEALSANQLKSLQETYEGAARVVLNSINDHKLQVEKLVGVIGNLGVTSGYQKAANHARFMTYVWQVVTVLALLGLVAVAILFVFFSSQALSWEGFAARLFLSVTFGVLAAYAAHQGDKQSETERRNRRLALEFEAVGPYLAPLDKSDQDKFRLDLGQRSFGQPEPAAKKSESPATALAVIQSSEFRTLLQELVRDAVKSKG